MTAQPGPPTTIGALRREVTRCLREQGLDTPDLDARLLVGHALNLDHAGLVREGERGVGADERRRIATYADRRLAGEPVARILGSQEFWGLRFAVTPAVLVPRPDTETVVEHALKLIDQTADPGTGEAPDHAGEPPGSRRHRPLRIADLGVGSGAIMLALLSELRGATAIGTDRCVSALAVARHNAGMLGLAERSRFVAGDFASALRGGFDVVVSNPPYIRSDEIAGLARDVRDHDPRLALDGGADGLGAYRAIAADARRVLRPGGHLIVEIGVGQNDAVAGLFAAQGLTGISFGFDLAGRRRTVAAQCVGQMAMIRGDT